LTQLEAKLQDEKREGIVIFVDKESGQIQALRLPAILLGTSPGEPSPHGYLTIGGADEATWYVEQAGKAWRETLEAVAWLLETAALLSSRKRP
jgi:hypothetical protein